MSEVGDPYDPNPYLDPPSSSPYGAAPPPGYPAGYPPGQGYPGYPPPGYPGYPGYVAYPGYPPWIAPARPGIATGANVLAFINGGFLVVAGLLLFLGASAINGIDNLGGPSHHLLSAELALDGLLDLAASGLLIGGAVSLGNRRSSGRVLLSVGGGIVLGESVYWLVRTDGLAGFWALLFGALVIVSLALAWASPVTAWLNRPTP